MKLKTATFTSNILLLAAIIFCSVTTTNAFEIPNPFASFKPASMIPSPVVSNTKQELLETISFTSNGKNADVDTQRRVLQLVRKLETDSPVSTTLLSNPEEAKALDGTWFLQYTQPIELDDDGDESSNAVDAWVPENSTEGESKIDTKPYKNNGSVGAVGIKVETANRVTKQIFDISQSRVSNSVEQDFGMINVEGSFRESDSVPNRAVVAFEKAEIALNNGITLNLGFVFSIIGATRGTKDNGWLETTYLDKDMRIGRGNKGSLFVLTRKQEAVKP
jgi:hypothetical protein